MLITQILNQLLCDIFKGHFFASDNWIYYLFKSFDHPYAVNNKRVVTLQWKSGGWVIDIYIIVISVRLNNESYILCDCILNVRLLFGSTLCHLTEQIRPETGNTLEFFCFSLFILIYVFLFMKIINIFLFGSTLCQLMEQLRT